MRANHRYLPAPRDAGAAGLERLWHALREAFPEPAGLRGPVLAVSTGPAPDSAASRPGDPSTPVALPLVATADSEAPAAGGATRDPDEQSGVPEGSQQVAVLLSRAQAGDADAFGGLYDHYVDTVYRYIAYRVPSRALAEDLTSEVFLRALRTIGNFSWQGRDPGAWFVTIARNLVADHYKSGRFRLEVATSEIREDPTPPAAGPEHQVLTSLRDRELLEAIRQLKPEQQECVVLRFLQGMSVAETAEVMRKNEGSIKALQFRAVRSLRRLLPADALPQDVS